MRKPFFLVVREQRDRGHAEAYADLVVRGPAGLLLAEAFMAATDWLPDGKDPYVDAYRNSYYTITGRSHA